MTLSFGCDRCVAYTVRVYAYNYEVNNIVAFPQQNICVCMCVCPFVRPTVGKFYLYERKHYTNGAPDGQVVLQYRPVQSYEFHAPVTVKRMRFMSPRDWLFASSKV